MYNKAINRWYLEKLESLKVSGKIRTPGDKTNCFSQEHTLTVYYHQTHTWTLAATCRTKPVLVKKIDLKHSVDVNID